MTTQSSLFHSDPEDIFAKAIERVEAGEAIEAVLATTPEAMRAELRELLLLITATHHLQRAPVPQPAAPRRADRKAAFLEAAAQMKPIAAAVSTPLQAATVAKAPPTKSSFGERLQNFWYDLQLGFASPNLRLAPLVIIIAAVWLGSFGFSEVADAAAIGDLVYPVKQWVRNQQLSLSSEAARGPVYTENVTKIIEDLTLATTTLSAAEQTTKRRVVKISTELFIFDEMTPDHLVFGPLRVMLHYQPDPNRDEYTSIVMPVTPGKGQQVELTFQILPADDPNAPFPFIIQGRRLTVPEVQLAIGPTPTAEAPAATSTATATATPCVITLPSGWVPYTVRAGDSLSAIAQRTGATLVGLQQVNCLVNTNDIVAGKMLFAPAIQQLNTPTATQPPLAATLTAISTTVLTPSVDITATVTVVLTDTVTVSPTATATENVTSTVTATVMAEVTPSITTTVAVTVVGTVVETPTVVQTPTPPMTVTLTSEAGDSGTVVATETLTDVIDPAPGTPIAPTAETTLETTTTPEAEGTVEGASVTPEGGEASPTPSPTPTLPLPTPTTEASEPPTATTVPEPTLAPTTEPTSKANQEPTTEPPTGESKQGNSGTTTNVALPTPTHTPIPQNHSPLTGG